MDREIELTFDYLKDRPQRTVLELIPRTSDPIRFEFQAPVTRLLTPALSN
jgi:hypothetical protein